MVNLYRLCDRGMNGIEWPDGGAVLDQPLRLIQSFNIVAAESAAARARQTP